ncbi:hypothetical protein R1flu_016909 [Riccia fluitans]|uniref:Uncharacterized protein n=1 Tax=Riccia fluitans TaxID=41844 RepID=A0ABD1YN66_9MARC
MDLNSELPKLDPVVIPPIPHRPFRCVGKGLRYGTFSRQLVDDLSSWPQRHPTTPFRRAKDWWRAQLLLYGLDADKHTTKVEVLTEKLKSAVGNGLEGARQTIIDLENELKVKFRIQNAEASDKNYLTRETDESRVEFYPKRFWMERFHRGKGRMSTL